MFALKKQVLYWDHCSSFAMFRRTLRPPSQYFKTVSAVVLRSQNTAGALPKTDETVSRKRDVGDSAPVRPFEEIPGPGKSFWSIVEFYRKTKGFTKPYKMHDVMFAKYGPIYKEELLGRPTVHLMDPNDFEKVFRAEGKYPKRPNLFDHMTEHRRRRTGNPGIFLS